jgi:hypothetical protein
MSVSVSGIDFVKPSQVLYSNPHAIDVLVREILSNMAEASIDMICDMPSEYPTKQSIEDCLQGVADMGTDFINDAIEELREKLLKRLQEVQVKPVVKAIHFNEKGYSDIEVDIELV